MEIANLLPVAVKVDKSDLPPALLESLKPLKSRRPGRFILEAAYCWLVVFGVITAAVYIDHWLATIFAILQIIIRWGAVCEHQYNRLGASVQETSPLIILKRWEKLLLPNLNFTYHIYHHYFPSMSFSQLPKAHDLFVEHGLVDDNAVFHGYWAYLKFLLSPAVTSSATQSQTS